MFVNVQFYLMANMLLAFESVTHHKISSASHAPRQCAYRCPQRKHFKLALIRQCHIWGLQSESRLLQLNAIQQAPSDLQYNLNEELASFPI